MQPTIIHCCSTSLWCVCEETPKFPLNCSALTRNRFKLAAHCECLRFPCLRGRIHYSEGTSGRQSPRSVLAFSACRPGHWRQCMLGGWWFKGNKNAIFYIHAFNGVDKTQQFATTIMNTTNTTFLLTEGITGSTL